MLQTHAIVSGNVVALASDLIPRVACGCALTSKHCMRSQNVAAPKSHPNISHPLPLANVYQTLIYSVQRLSLNLVHCLLFYVQHVVVHH